MTDLGNLFLRLGAPTEQLAADLQAADTMSRRFHSDWERRFSALSLGNGLADQLTKDLQTVDAAIDKTLAAINRRSDVKIKVRFDETGFSSAGVLAKIAQLNNQKIKVGVDLEPLHQLNRLLDVKQQHIKQTAALANATVIKPKVDLSDLRKFEEAIGRAEERLQNFEKAANQPRKIVYAVEVDARSLNNLGNQKLKVDLDAGSIGNSLRQGVSHGFGDIEKSFAQSLGKAVKKATSGDIFGAIMAPVNSIARGALENVGREFSKGFTRSLSTAFADALSSQIGSSEMLGEKIGDAIARQIGAKLQSIDEELSGNAVYKAAKGKVVGFRDEFLDKDEVRGASASRKVRKEDRTDQRREEQARDLNYERQSIAREELRIQNEKAVAQSDEAFYRNMAAKSAKRARQAPDRQTRNEYENIGYEFEVQEAEAADHAIKLGREEQKIRRKRIATNKSIDNLAPQKSDAELEVIRVAEEVAGRKLKKREIPKVVNVDPAYFKGTGGQAAYVNEANALVLQDQYLQSLNNGTVGMQQYSTLPHEVTHGDQADWGSIEGLRRNRPPQRNFTPEQLAWAIPQVNQVNPETGLPLYKPEEKPFELDAYANQARLGYPLYQQYSKPRNLDAFRERFGVYGEGVDQEFANKKSVQAGILEKITSQATPDQKGSINELITQYQEISRGSTIISAHVKKAIASGGISEEFINEVAAQFAKLDDFAAELDKFAKTKTSPYRSVPSPFESSSSQYWASRGTTLAGNVPDPFDDSSSSYWQRANASRKYPNLADPFGAIRNPSAVRQIPDPFDQSSSVYWERQKQLKNNPQLPQYQGRQKITPWYEQSTPQSFGQEASIELYRPKNRRFDQQAESSSSGQIIVAPARPVHAEVVGDSLAKRIADQANTLMGQAIPVAGRVIRAAKPIASGMGRLAKGAIGAANQGYQFLEGVESEVLPYVPFGGAIKSVGKNLALPAAAYGILGMVPGGQAIQHGLGGATEALLSLPGSAAIDSITGLAGEAFGGVPMIGPAITQGTHALAAGGVDALVDTMVPIVAGKLALGAGNRAKKALLPESDTGKAKQLGGSVGQKALSAASGLVTTEISPLNALGGGSTFELPGALQGLLKLLPMRQKNLRESYRSLQAAVKKGDETTARQLALMFKEHTAKMLAEIEAAKKELGDRTGQTTVGKQLLNAQAEVGKKGAGAKRILAQLPAASDDDDLTVRYSRSIGDDEFEKMSQSLNEKREAEAEKRRLRREEAAAREAAGTPRGPSKINKRVFYPGFGSARGGFDYAAFGPSRPRNRRNQELNRLNAGIGGASESVQSPGEVAVENAIAQAEFREYAFGAVGEVNQNRQRRRQSPAGRAKLQQANEFAEVGKGARDIAAEVNRQNVLTNQALDDIASGASAKTRLAALREDLAASKDLKGGLSDLFGVAKGAGLAFVGFQVLSTLGPLVSGFAKDILDLTSNFEQLRLQVQLGTGSLSGGAQKFEAIKTEAKSLGLSQQGALETASKIGATTFGTELEGAPTDRITTNTLEVAQRRGLSKQNISGLDLALSQILGSKRVGAEELNQLRESGGLPDARNIGARALGMSNQQFTRALESPSGINPQKFVSAFLQQASTDSLLIKDESLNTQQAKLTKLQSSVEDFQLKIGEGISPVFKAGIDAANGAVGLLTKGIELGSKMLVGLAVISLGPIIGAMWNLGRAAIAAGANAAALSNAMKGLSAGLNLGVLLVVGEAANQLAKTMADAGEETNKSVAKIKAALADLNGTEVNAKVGLELPKTTGDIQGTDWIDDIKLGFQRSIQGRQKIGGVQLPSSILPLNLVTPFLGDVPVDDKSKAQDDRERARANLYAQFNPTVAAAAKARAAARQITASDLKVNQLTSQRDALSTQSPDDVSGLRRLSEQINAEYQKRQKIQEPISKAQSAIQQTKTAYQAELEQIEKLRSLPKPQITEGEYTTALARINDGLKRIKAEEEELAKALRSPLDNTVAWTNQLKIVESRFSAIAEQSSRLATQQQQVRDQLEASGKITPGQSSYQASLDKQLATVKEIKAIEANIRSLDAQLNTLDPGAINSALKNYGVNYSAISAAELKQVSENAPEGQDKTTLGYLATRKEQEIKLESLRANVDTERKELNAKIKAENQEIRDYYKGLVRAVNPQDVANQRIISSIRQARDRFAINLTGFGSSLADGFFDAITELLKVGQDRVEAEAQRVRDKANAENTFRDTIDTNRIKREGLTAPTGAGQVSGNFDGLLSTPIANQSLAQATRNTTQFGAGRPGGRAHTKTDLAAPVGTPVLATESGVATLERNVPWNYGKKQYNSEAVVNFRSNDGMVSRRSFHLDKKTWELFGDRNEMRVTAGQPIGYVGRDGDLPGSVGSHSDENIKINGRPVSLPEYYRFRGVKPGAVKPGVRGTNIGNQIETGPIGNIQQGLLKATADTIAKYESSNDYFAANAGGRFSEAEARQGFPASQIGKRHIPGLGVKDPDIGRYQFRYDDYKWAQQYDPSIRTFLPQDQDKIMYAKITRGGRGGQELLEFQKSPTYENAVKVRRALGNEWEAFRDGTVLYGGGNKRKDGSYVTGPKSGAIPAPAGSNLRNFWGGESKDRQFHQRLLRGLQRAAADADVLLASAGISDSGGLGFGTSSQGEDSRIAQVSPFQQTRGDRAMNPSTTIIRSTSSSQAQPSPSNPVVPANANPINRFVDFLKKNVVNVADAKKDIAVRRGRYPSMTFKQLSDEYDRIQRLGINDPEIKATLQYIWSLAQEKKKNSDSGRKRAVTPSSQQSSPGPLDSSDYSSNANPMTGEVARPDPGNTAANYNQNVELLGKSDAIATRNYAASIESANQTYANTMSGLDVEEAKASDNIRRTAKDSRKAARTRVRSAQQSSRNLIQLPKVLEQQLAAQRDLDEKIEADREEALDLLEDLENGVFKVTQVISMLKAKPSLTNAEKDALKRAETLKGVLESSLAQVTKDFKTSQSNYTRAREELRRSQSAENRKTIAETRVGGLESDNAELGKQKEQADLTLQAEPFNEQAQEQSRESQYKISLNEAEIQRIKAIRELDEQRDSGRLLIGTGVNPLLDPKRAAEEERKLYDERLRGISSVNQQAIGNAEQQRATTGLSNQRGQEDASTELANRQIEQTNSLLAAQIELQKQSDAISAPFASDRQIELQLKNDMLAEELRFSRELQKIEKDRQTYASNQPKLDALDAEEKKIREVNVANRARIAGDTIANLRSRKIEREDYGLSILTKKDQAGLTLEQARTDRIRGFGGDTKNEDYRAAVTAQNISFRTEKRELEKQRDAIQGTDIAAVNARNDIQDLIDSLEQLNQTKLDNLRDSLNPLNQALSETQKSTRGVLEEFVLTGKVKDPWAPLRTALTKTLSSLLDGLTTQLFSGLYQKTAPNPSAGGGGDTWLNLGLSAVRSIFGFDSGGVVGFDPAQDSLRKGDNPIARALQKEGPTGQVIVAKRGERILNLDETRQYDRLMRNPVYNYTTGGFAGMPPIRMPESKAVGVPKINTAEFPIPVLPVRSAGSSDEINVNVNVSGDFDKPGVNQAEGRKMLAAIEGVVQQALIDHKRRNTGLF